MTKKFIARINATHSGFVNFNNTWYLDEDVSNGVDTWIDPYNKPLLVHHETKKDAIGRVISAKYLPMQDSKKKKKSNYPAGYIQLEVEVSDQEAIQKFKDKRYNTVSITADASKASCSICGQDLVKDGLCEHKRGNKYNGKKCFWYLGGLRYKEVSVVNVPADEYAETESFEERDMLTFQDSVKTSIFQLENNVDSDDTEECEDWSDYTESDLELAYWLMTEIDNELIVEDKALTTEQRKKLKKSTFCGPSKSFPVPDCQHVTAARRLIGRYKGSGNKSKILACVERKAKKLGCDNKSDSVVTNAPSDERVNDSLLIGGNEMQVTLQDALALDDVKKHIDSEIQKATQPFKDQLAGMSALTEKATKLETEVTQKDSELSSQKELLLKLEDSVTNLKAEVHKTYVDRVFDLRKNLQKKDVLELKDEQAIEAYKAELAKRTDESLKDAVADLSKEVVPEIKTKLQVVSTGDNELENTDSTKVEKKEDKISKIIFAD